jgi:hypothetical protein
LQRVPHRREVRRNSERSAPAGTPHRPETPHDDGQPQIASPMLSTKIALYRASLLADNLGIRLCAAAVMVMPSALVFLLPVLALLGAPDEATLPGVPVPDGGAVWALLSFALGVGFAAAWMRIVFTGGRLLRRPGLRRFVTAGLGLGIVAIVLELGMLPASESQQDAGWLLLASLAVITFLLAGMLGQPRTDRLHRI